MDKKYTILIVDDKVENLQYLSNILNKEYDIRASTDGKLSIEAAHRINPDLILMDINLPEMDGYEVCKLIKENKKLVDVPVIFISAYEDIDHKIKAFENGGLDYITKPFQPKEVQARIKTQLEIFDNKKTITKLLQQQDLFVKKIMHEMNTPLSVISLNLDTLERNLGSKNEFESMKASIKTLSSIYGDLSYMIKKESKTYTRKKINLINFLSSRVMFFDEMASIKDISIQCEFDEEFFIYINEYELERILDNTLSNAIKYSNNDTIITISLEKIDQESFLKISDQGIGIEKDFDLFLPYYQQSESNSGLGLGLCIVKEICDKYHIEIDIESQKDVGSTFTYNLTPVIKESL